MPPSLEATSPFMQAAYDYPKPTAYNCRNPRTRRCHFLVLRPLLTKETMLVISGAKEPLRNAFSIHGIPVADLEGGA
jgi:hypothetical protein